LTIQERVAIGVPNVMLVVVVVVVVVGSVGKSAREKRSNTTKLRERDRGILVVAHH
jgi:hypothetical protein